MFDMIAVSGNSSPVALVGAAVNQVIGGCAPARQTRVYDTRGLIVTTTHDCHSVIPTVEFRSVQLVAPVATRAMVRPVCVHGTALATDGGTGGVISAGGQYAAFSVQAFSLYDLLSGSTTQIEAST